MRKTRLKKTAKAASLKKGSGKSERVLRESPPPRMKDREYVGYNMAPKEAGDIRKDLKDGAGRKKKEG